MARSDTKSKVDPEDVPSAGRALVPTGMDVLEATQFTS
jgi:hypothetical protein